MTGRPFKIAVAGTHSTGKTTFVEGLRAAFEARGVRVEYVHDSAVDARDLGFKILTGHTFESTAWLIAQAIQLEAKAALVAEVILVDRPVPDALGYLLAALRHTGRELEAGRFARLEAICAAWAGEYDLTFVTRLDPTIPLGDGRDGDEAFRRAAALAVREVVDRHVSETHVLDSGGAAAAVEASLRAYDQWRMSEPHER